VFLKFLNLDKNFVFRFDNNEAACYLTLFSNDSIELGIPRKGTLGNEKWESVLLREVKNGLLEKYPEVPLLGWFHVGLGTPQMFR
jgi:hypothetical protein